MNLLGVGTSTWDGLGLKMGHAQYVPQPAEGLKAAMDIHSMLNPDTLKIWKFNFSLFTFDDYFILFY